MPRISGVDWSSVEAYAGFEPLPAGTYRAKVEKFSLGKTNAGDKDMFTVEAEITDSPDDPTLVGRKIFDRIVLQTDKGQPNKVGHSQVKSYAIATLGEERANGDFDTDEFLNGEVMIELSQRTYASPTEKDATGKAVQKLSNEVKRVLPV